MKMTRNTGLMTLFLILWSATLTSAANVTISDIAIVNEEYGVVFGSFTWEQAKAECTKYGGHLAAITNKAENALLNLARWGDKCWIGLHKDTSNSWTDSKWLDDPSTVSFFNWGAKQPTSAAGDNCVHMGLGTHVSSDANRKDEAWYSAKCTGLTSACCYGANVPDHRYEALMLTIFGVATACISLVCIYLVMREFMCPPVVGKYADHLLGETHAAIAENMARPSFVPIQPNGPNGAAKIEVAQEQKEIEKPAEDQA